MTNERRRLLIVVALLLLAAPLCLLGQAGRELTKQILESSSQTFNISGTFDFNTGTWRGRRGTCPPAASACDNALEVGQVYTCTDVLGDLYVCPSVAGWVKATGGGGSSPLTTKGDLYTRSASADARLAVGTNGSWLIADSAQTTGNRWLFLPDKTATWPMVGVTGTGVAPLGVNRTKKAEFSLPRGLEFDRLQIRISAASQSPVNESGSIALYSADGQTKYLGCDGRDWTAAGAYTYDLTSDCGSPGVITLMPNRYSVVVNIGEATVRFYGFAATSPGMWRHGTDGVCSVCFNSPATDPPAVTQVGIALPAISFYRND